MSTDNVNKRPTSDRVPVDETDVAEVHDIVQEDDDDFVETADDAVEDVRSQVVINHFRV